MKSFIKNRNNIEAYWTFVELTQPKGVSDAEFIEQVKEQRRAHKLDKRRRKYPKGSNPVIVAKKNQVVNGLIFSIIERMVGTATIDQDLEGRFIAIGTNNTTPALTQTQLLDELFRAVPTDKFQDNNKAEFILYVDKTTGNGFSTTVVTDPGNTDTIFLVDDASGFAEGQTIRVTTTSQFNFVTITDITGDTLTVTPALADLPLNGQQVIQVWSEAAVFGNTTATITPDSGDMFNRVNQLGFVKDNTKIILIEVQFVFTAL